MDYTYKLSVTTNLLIDVSRPRCLLLRFQVVLCCFASQELRLLSHVFDTAASGDAEGVCDAIERFGEDVLNPAGQWLKVP